MWNISTAVLGFFVCGVLVVCGRMLKRSGRKVCTYDTTAATLIFSLIGTFNTCLWALVQAMSTILTSGPYLVNPESTRDIYKGRWNFVSNFVAPVGTFFVALALLQISLMWIEVSVRTGRFTAVTRNRLVHTQRMVYVFQVCAVLLGISGAITEKTRGKVAMGFFVAPLVVAIVFTYMYGAHKLNGIINSSASDRNRYLASEEGSSKDGFSTSNNRIVGSDGDPIGGTDDEDEESGSFDRPTGGNGASDVSSYNPGALASAQTAPSSPSAPSATTALTAPASPTLSRSPSVPKMLTKTSLYVSSLNQKFNMSRRKPSIVLRNAALFKVLKRIRNTSYAVSASLVLFGSSYFALAVIDNVNEEGWKELAQPGKFPAVKAVHNLLMTSVILSQVVVAWYLYQSISALAPVVVPRRRRQRPRQQIRR